MSKKYLEQFSGTGVSTKKVVSKFGSKILGKLGWNEGQGLGKNKDGITECIQVRKREENLGLGAAVNKTEWNNQWWANNYENILGNVKIEASEKTTNVIEKQESSASTTSEDEEEIQIKKVKITKTKKSIEVESDEKFLSRKRKIKILKL